MMCGLTSWGQCLRRWEFWLHRFTKWWVKIHTEVKCPEKQSESEKSKINIFISLLVCLSLSQWVGAKQHELQVNSMQLLYYQVWVNITDSSSRESNQYYLHNTAGLVGFDLQLDLGLVSLRWQLVGLGTVIWDFRLFGLNLLIITWNWTWE